MGLENLMLLASYDRVLVLFSVLVAMFASYTALDLAGRITAIKGRARYLWLAGGALAMGTGIWWMHFVGMLAFRLPIALGYDPLITAASLLVAIAASGFALWLVCQETMPYRRLVLGAALMGIAVAGMHYTGMAAMLMRPGIDYDPWLFTLSILIATLAGGAALWIAFRLRRLGRHIHAKRLGAAIIMGCAIASMHYVGVAAARFPLGSVCLAAASSGLRSESFVLPILLTTIFILAVALITSVLDLRLAMRTGVLVESLSAANQELAYLALHDKLTKLPNRALLEDRFEQAIQAAAKGQLLFAVLFVDLDGFKIVNDSYGHHVGDQLLAEAAQRICASAGPLATVSRVGGDEFILLVDVEAPEDAGALAERILAGLCLPILVAGHELLVSGSIGIAMYPANGTEQRALLRHADAAMYHAKSLGRNTYVYYAHSMHVDVQARLNLANDLRLALGRNEFELHYQAKFKAPSGPIIGAEALLRWNHPTQGLLSPIKFIPLAEKTGLIIEIGRWVLDKACQQLASWHREGHSDWTMAVNLSAVQFCDENLITTIRDTLARHALAPACLTLEITESVAMRDVETGMQVINQLSGMGIQVAIDDFGTGYSNLLYLKRIPASELKIDREFVRNLERDGEDAAIVSAIIALGKTLNLKIVAEGVETPDQQAFLTSLGCDMLQGYLLAKPVPAAAFLNSAEAPV